MRLPVTFYRAGPADYVVRYVAGERRAEGRGLVCFVGPRTSIARVPTADLIVPFAFTELTADDQQVVVHGSARIRFRPTTIVDRVDFAIDPWTGEHLAEEEPEESVREEVRRVLQAIVRDAMRPKDLRAAIAAAAELTVSIDGAVAGKRDALAALGVDVLDLAINAVVPANPDLKKALEAEAREQMLAAADRALAERRQAAAASERTLKEYEADTAERLEARRKALVVARNANLVAEATADAEAIAKRLAPYQDIEAPVLLALGIRELATSGKVGQVTFTPDFLAAVQSAARPNGKE